MKLDIVCLIFLGYAIELGQSDGQGKHVHLKIHVPQLIHKHTHKHTVYKHHHHHPGHGEKKHIVLHKHEHKHDHGHKHGHKHKHKHGHKHDHKHHAKHGHKHDHKHKHKHDHKHKNKKEHDYDYGHHYGHYGLPEHKFESEDIGLDDNGYTKQKQVRTEHYEVKKINPHATWPGDRVTVHGSYKVQETDPHDFTTTSVHSYDSPSSKVLAEILTNFGGRYDNYHPFNRKSEENKEDEEEDYLGHAPKDKEKKETDYYQNNDIEDDHEEYSYPYSHYEDEEDDKNKNSAYQVSPYEDTHEADDDVHGENYNYGTEGYEKFIYRKVYGSDYDK